MRPKKTVIVYSADTQLLSEWSFILTIMGGFKVRQYSKAPDLVTAVNNQPGDGLLLIVPSIDAAEDILVPIQWFGQAVIHVPNKPDRLPDWVGLVHVHDEGESPAIVISSLRMTMLRKRGPRKVIHFPVQSVVPHEKAAHAL